MSPEEKRDQWVRALGFAGVSWDEGICAAKHAGPQINVALCLTLKCSVFAEPKGIIGGILRQREILHDSQSRGFEIPSPFPQWH